MPTRGSEQGKGRPPHPLPDQRPRPSMARCASAAGFPRTAVGWGRCPPQSCVAPGWSVWRGERTVPPKGAWLKVGPSLWHCLHPSLLPQLPHSRAPWAGT